MLSGTLKDGAVLHTSDGRDALRKSILAHFDALSCGVGGLLSEFSYPQPLNPAYGYRPASFMLFVRARL